MAMHPDVEKYLKTDYQKKVFERFVRMLMRRDPRLPREDAESLVHDGVEKVILKGHTFNPAKGVPEAWVSRIIGRTLQDYWRKPEVKKRSFLRTPAEAEGDASGMEEQVFRTDPDQDDYIAKKQFFNWYMRALSKVSDSEAKVLLLRYGFKMDNPRIASVLKKTLGATAKLLSTGKEAMFKSSDSEFVSPPDNIDFTLTRKELSLLLKGDTRAVAIVEDFLFNGLSASKTAEKHGVDVAELDRLIGLLLESIRDGLVKRRATTAGTLTPDEAMESFFSGLFLEGFLSLLVEKYAESLAKKRK